MVLSNIFKAIKSINFLLLEIKIFYNIYYINLNIKLKNDKLKFLEIRFPIFLENNEMNKVF
jgi:hypothetical protein